MQQISFSYDVQYSIDASLSAVFEFLADVRNIIACSSDIEHSEIIDTHTAKCRLKRQEQFGLSFTPEYTLRYDFQDGNSIAWRTLEGNVAVHAQLTLTTLDDGRTRASAHEEIQFELPVSPIMAKMVSAFAKVETRNEMQQWFKCAAERLKQSLPAAAVSN